MGKHSIEAICGNPDRKVRIGHTVTKMAKHVKHPVTHISGAVTLHVVALVILEHMGKISIFSFILH